MNKYACLNVLYISLHVFIINFQPEPKGELKNRKDFIFMEDLPADAKGQKQNFGYVRYFFYQILRRRLLFLFCKVV